MKLTLDIPAELHAQLLARRVDIKETALAALVAAVKGSNIVHQATEEPKRGPGRPAGRTREKRSINLEPRIWSWLDAQMQPGESFNDTCNRVLGELVDRGKKS